MHFSAACETGNSTVSAGSDHMDGRSEQQRRIPGLGESCTMSPRIWNDMVMAWITSKPARVTTMASLWETRATHCINNNHKINLPPLQRTLINRNYAKLWYGQAVSAVGDCVFGTTLVLWVSQVLANGRSWAPAAVSGILVAASAAFSLVGPFAGVFVDRW
jgi:hypothetical protein